MKKPEWIELSGQQLEELLERIKGSVGQDDYQILERIVRMLQWLLGVVERKSLSIRRLQRLLFGPKTERAHKGPDQGPPKAGADSSQEAASTPSPAPEKPRRKGHGRRPASSYTGARSIIVAHESLCRGACCPNCRHGRLYLIPPAQRILVSGSPVLAAERYEIEELRCSGCGAVFGAKVPPEVSGPKYAPSAASAIAVATYGAGLPYYRLERMQEDFGVPVPASTQWHLSEAVAKAAAPVVGELIGQGAQSPIFFNDDTKNRILQIAGSGPAPESQRDPVPAPSKKRRCGVFTSATLFEVGRYTVALFFTGVRTAGENLARVLEHRVAGLPPPIHMCDALHVNFAPSFKVILAHCIAHARRKFYELTDRFPGEVQFLLDELAKVYHNDELTKGMSAQERLQYHLKHSRPIMTSIRTWGRKLLADKKVEPNSSLGDAITYMLDHWKQLVVFLWKPGAPLDNNITERSLKLAILRRKNSYFYRTVHGAWVGDTLMSLIHTCRLCGVNPVPYLTALQVHAERVRANPADWFPWIYHQTMARCDSS